MPLIIGSYLNETLQDETCLYPGMRYLMQRGRRNHCDLGWLVDCDVDDGGGVIQEVEYPRDYDWNSYGSAPGLVASRHVNVVAGSLIELSAELPQSVVKLTVERPAVDLESIPCLFCGSELKLFNFGPHTFDHIDRFGSERDTVIRQLGLYRRAAGASLPRVSSYPLLIEAINGFINDIDWGLFGIARGHDVGVGRYDVIRLSAPRPTN